MGDVSIEILAPRPDFPTAYEEGEDDGRREEGERTNEIPLRRRRALDTNQREAAARLAGSVLPLPPPLLSLSLSLCSR